MYAPPKREAKAEEAAPKAVIIQGAPWNPAAGATEEVFPSLGANGHVPNGTPVPAFGAWGRRH